MYVMHSPSDSTTLTPIPVSVGGEYAPLPATAESHQFELRGAPTEANKQLVGRALLMFVSMLPMMVYTAACVGTSSFEPYYVALAASPPFLLLVSYIVRYWNNTQQLVHDSQCPPITKFQQLSPYWIWAFHLVAPLLGVVSTVGISLFVQQHKEAGDRAAVFRVFWCATILAPVFFNTAGIMGAARQRTSSEEERWAGEKAAFESAHDGAVGLVDTFEQYAVQRADAATVHDSSRVMMATGLAALILVSAVVSATGWVIEAGWPIWACVVSVSLAVLVFLPYGGSVPLLILIVLPNPYFVCTALMEAMEKCTNERSAAAEGLPHLPIDSADGLWK